MQTSVASFLLSFHLPGIFLGAFFFGETIIIPAAFLAAQGWWSYTTVFLLSLVATILSDCMWFLVGHYLFEKKTWFQKYEQKYKRVVLFLDKTVGSHPYRGLLIIKFLYGTRILTMIYLARRKVNFWKFLFFNFLGSSLLLVVVVGIGFLAAKGYEKALTVFHEVSYVISGIVVIIVLFKLVTLWLSKKVVGE